MMTAISTALSGLLASTAQLDASASNIANANSSGPLSGTNWGPATSVTPGKPGGGNAAPQAYQPVAIVQSATSGGVSFSTVAINPVTQPAFQPDMPYANADGLVAMPNVDMATEIVKQITARDAYRANIETIRTADEMQRSLLSIV